MNQELYDLIKDHMAERLDITEEDVSLLVHELTVLAVEGAQEYVTDLEESIGHLKETIKRLTKE